MATTYQDLGGDGHFQIDVRVRDVSTPDTKNRASELSVEDTEGTRFQFIIWESSEQGRSYDWKTGSWYRLSGVTANEWPSGTVPHGTSSLEIELLGEQRTDGDADVLYFTDSHLGKTSHEYKGQTWSVSPKKGFRAAIDCAISEQVDAVIHGGDLFHNPGDGIAEEEIAVCREGLTRLAENGIQFYFIYGNHERQAGRRVMERFVDDNLAVHLGPRYEVVENAVALYGVDHQSEWADHVLDIEDAPDGLETILCVHQSVAPFTASTNPDCLLGDIEAATSGSMDVILTGHVHTRLERRSTTSHGLSGGATTRVGEDRGELQPSVELISSGAMDPQRHYL